MKRYRIQHRTEYAYEEDVTLAHSEARLSPRTTGFQNAVHTTLFCVPAPTHAAERLDGFGNRIHSFSVERAHRRLEVTAESEVEVRGSVVPPEARADISWEAANQILLSQSDAESLHAREMLLDSPMAARSPALHAYARPCFAPGRDLLDACRELNARIYSDFEYKPGFSTVGTPLREVLEHRSGVCQDFAHLFIACARSFGAAARYVSGYLETLPPPGQEKLTGADASHAWVAVYAPGTGWVDFDPTNNLIPGEQHITLAVGRDFTDVTPLKGVIFGGGKHTVDVSVDVLRLEENGAA